MSYLRAAIVYRMIAPITENANTISIRQKLAAYIALAKPRLAMLVVFSSVVGYSIGATAFSWLEAFYLSISGLLVTGASNGFNQILERDIDLLMNRTRNRPLPTGKLTVLEGMVLCTLLFVAGELILFFQFNTLSAILGAFAFFSYVLVYTPLKKHTSWAVFAGAFPGAIPPMLGYVAATNDFDLFAGLLFANQFIWQFPHFWAIAWLMFDDYAKAGYQLLPSKGGKDGQSAFSALLYTLFLVPVGLLPWAFNLVGTTAAVVSVILAGLFVIPAIKLYWIRSDKWAKRLMFASFFYLPFIQLIYLFDRIS